MVWGKTKTFAEMIKFEHSIFALPFAYLGAFLAWVYLGNKGIPRWQDLVWITLAMVGARTAAMSLNRLIDRQIDARNPRTAMRAIPSGKLGLKEVWVYTLLSFGLLLIAAWNLNPLHQAIPLTVKLMPIPVFALAFYPYTKRFTWLCHMVLGLSIALGPMGAWIAITGRFDLPGVLLSLAVAFWIAGFDIIYACQDYEFDTRAGIESMPARFGIKNGLLLSSAFHVITVFLFFMVGIILRMGFLFWAGVIIAAGILIYEHRLVSPNDLSRLDAAFFNMNGILSLILFIFTLLEVV